MRRGVAPDHHPGRGDHARPLPPAYERTLARMGSVLPYRRARSLLDEFFPLGDAPEVETIRQRTLHVGARFERAAAALPTSAPPTKAKSITLTIDGGHVKAVRNYTLSTREPEKFRTTRIEPTA
jgi:hypothetical protein